MTQKVLRHVGTAHNEEKHEKIRKMAEYLKETIEAELHPKLFSKEELDNSIALPKLKI